VNSSKIGSLKLVVRSLVASAPFIRKLHIQIMNDTGVVLTTSRKANYEGYRTIKQSRRHGNHSILLPANSRKPIRHQVQKSSRCTTSPQEKKVRRLSLTTQVLNGSLLISGLKMVLPPR
jgi:hypothetical protein